MCIENYFREGETTYDVEDAQSLRIKLAKLGENIDATSKRILILGVKKNTEDPQEIQGQELRLYQMVRTSAMIFLKEELLTLQPLSSAEEYAILQEERQKRIDARTAYERQSEEEQREKLREQRKRDTRNLDNSPSIKINQVVYTNKACNRINNWRNLIPNHAKSEKSNI